MTLRDEEVRIDAADWGALPSWRGPDLPQPDFFQRAFGTFPPTDRRRAPSDWSGPGRRRTDPEIDRFEDDGGLVR